MTLAGRIHEIVGARAIIKNFLLEAIKVKYRRSVLGFLWSLLNPLLMLIVISAAFATLFAGTRGQYTLHLLATLLPWTCVALSLEGGCRAILNSENYIRQYRFPKLIFPLRTILFAFVELLLSLLALFPIALFLGMKPGPQLAILPYAILLLLIMLVGLAAMASVAVVYFRDAEHLISVFMRAWFYLTPILIPYDAIPEKYQRYFALNPMYHMLELFDAPISRGLMPSTSAILTATIIAALCFVVGLSVFFRLEDDVIFRL